MMRKCALILTAASLVLGLGGGCDIRNEEKPTEPQRLRDVAGSVTCTISSSTYRVDNAKISIADKSDTTDLEGFFLIAEVPYGEHQLRVEKTGYVTSEQPVEISEETPSPLSVSIEENDDLMIFGEEVIPLEFTLNGNNFSVTEQPLQNATIETLADKIFGEGGQRTLAGTTKVIKLSDKLDARVMTILGKTIRLSGGLAAGSFIWRLKNNEGNFFEPGERLEVVYEVKVKSPDGYDRIFVIQPTSLPSTAMGRTITDEERQIFLESDYELRMVSNSRADLKDALVGVIDAAGLTCTFYSVAIFVTGGAAAPGVVLVCAGVGTAQILTGVLDVVSVFIGPNDKVGIYCRKPGFQGVVTDPFICLVKMPDPHPAPLTALRIYPDDAEVKLDGELRFTAIARDQQGKESDATNIATWSLEGVGGTVTNGFFIPSQPGSGYVVASLKPAWNLEASAEVTVLPVNRPPECDVLWVTPVVDPCRKTYSIQCQVMDPDDDVIQGILLEYGDGKYESIPPSELYIVNSFSRTHCYSTRPADVTLRLTSTDVDGATCTSTYPLHIPANQSPVSHPVCPTGAKVGVPVALRNEATDDSRVVYYRWGGEFGVKYTDEPHIDVTFLTPGSKIVFMSAKDDEDEWSQIEQCQLEVGEDCQQGIIIRYPAQVKVNGTITICADATCIGPGYDPIRFIFTKDGQSWHDSYQKCHTIIPSVPGRMHFCVELVDAKGNRILKCVDVDVVEDNQAPIADPGGPYDMPGGGSFTPDGSGSSDPDGDPLTEYVWTFQGQTYSGAQPIIPTPSVGSYPLTLKVRDSKGLWSAVASTTVTVQQPALGYIEVTSNVDEASGVINPGGYTFAGRYTRIDNVSPGTYTITWHAVADHDTPASQAKTLTSDGAILFNGFYSPKSEPVRISGPTEITVKLGEKVEWVPTVTGGTTNYYIIWCSYTELPAGLSGDSRCGVSGYPSVLGDFQWTATAHDAGDPSNTASITVTLHVNRGEGNLCVITQPISGPIYFDGVYVGEGHVCEEVPANTTIDVTAGHVDGYLEPGGRAITLQDGEVATIYINYVSSGCNPPYVVIEALGFNSTAYVGRWYSGGLSYTSCGAAGPPKAYLVSGAFPPGIGWVSQDNPPTNPNVSGTPTRAGTFTFTIRIEDRSNPPLTDERTFSITVY